MLMSFSAVQSLGRAPFLVTGQGVQEGSLGRTACRCLKRLLYSSTATVEGQTGKRGQRSWTVARCPDTDGEGIELAIFLMSIVYFWTV